MLPSLVEEWTCENVAEWLEIHGFLSHKGLLCDVHCIDGIALLALSETDLKQTLLDISLGDMKRLYVAIRRLQMKNIESMLRLGLSVEVPSNLSGHNLYSSSGIPSEALGSFKGNHVGAELRHRLRRDSLDSSSSDDVSPQSSYPHDGTNHHGPPLAHNLEPEFWKTGISIGYFFLVTWITAIVMVIVHDRVPDMQRYPPLPDIFLDNVPHIPWAFEMCEVTACILGSVWLVILVFHKHRFIILRRMFAIFGSVFLLRCVTMLITSLSVPGRHLVCASKVPSVLDFWAKIGQAFAIWRSAGMSIQGVRTCGDYMFSGHTVTLTMFNFFITEYTPRRLYYLHTFTWVLNVFGIFFILAAHEHYSIDVFIAFYISTRLFLYYHTLANNRDLMQRDSKRTRIWFPLFSFFESRVGGIVPNEFQNPFCLCNLKKCIHFATSTLISTSKTSSKR